MITLSVCRANTDVSQLLRGFFAKGSRWFTSARVMNSGASAGLPRRTLRVSLNMMKGITWKKFGRLILRETLIWNSRDEVSHLRLRYSAGKSARPMSSRPLG